MTSCFFNDSRYGSGARKASGFRDSGGRKPEVLIRVVSDGCGRERKPRIMSMVVPEALLTKLLDSARPQGRAGQRARRKGRGSVQRRKEARRRARGEGMSTAAREFSTRSVAPPLPREPEPGSCLYRAVAEKLLAEEGKVEGVESGASVDFRPT